MQYKTIILELLMEGTELHERLRLTRRLLPVMESMARDLKTRHEHWMEELALTSPDSYPSQISSEAMELALCELAEHLPSMLPAEGEPLSLDQAMAFVLSPTLKK